MAAKKLLQATQKDSEARRAKNRRAEAYLFSTLERGDRVQRSIWVFFSGLLVAEELIKGIALFCALQRLNAPADLFHKLCVPHDLHSFQPTVVFIFANDNGNRLAVPGIGYDLVPALDAIHQLAKFGLHL